MAPGIADIQKEIQALNTEEKTELPRTLVAELDAPADPNTEQAWPAATPRCFRELVEAKVQSVPGQLVFERLRSRLGQ